MIIPLTSRQYSSHPIYSMEILLPAKDCILLISSANKLTAFHNVIFFADKIFTFYTKYVPKFKCSAIWPKGSMYHGLWKYF